jgi:hypothetical protein
MFNLASISMDSHHVQDLLLYIPFLVGQLVYIMKRAGFSMRAGRAPTRRAYIYQNWDILAFRSVLEFILVYTPFRHYSPNQLLTVFHVDLSGVSWLSFLQTPVESPVSFLFLGIGADGMFDWFVDWASRSPKVPQPVRNWLTENVPPMTNGVSK